MIFRDPNTRPEVLPPNFVNIPQELRDVAQWVLYRLEWKEDSKQWAKIPYDANTAQKARSNDRSTFAPFEKARAIYLEGKQAFDGIGFVFTAEDEFCGIDFDECLDNHGNISDPFAKEWIEKLDSYTEKSVSCTGLHAIVKASVGAGIKRGKVEVYDRLRYFTFTGACGKRKEIRARQAEIENLKAVLTPPKPQQSTSPVVVSHSVQTLLEKAFSSRNGEKIRSLYNGHLNGHGSQSEADLSLVSLLAFWSGGDSSVLDQMFRGSRLFRQKWDKRHSGDGKTYGQITIDKALSDCTEFYRSAQTETSHSNGSKPQTAKTTLMFTKLVDLLAEPQEEISYVWANTLPSGGFSIVAAKPKVGKSTLARVLAVRVSQGEPFFGRPTKKGVVLYLCLEEKRAEVAEHFRRMGASSSDILIFTGKTPADVLLALEDAIEQYSPVLVIIDPLSRFLRIADFNSYAEVTRALEPLIDLARSSKCGTHIMALHHNGKSGDMREAGDAVMGSSAIFGAVDCLLTMRKRDRARTIESTQRYGEDLQETIVNLNPITGIVEAAGDMAEFELSERKKAVMDSMRDEPLTESAIKELVSGSNSGLTSKAVRSLYDEGSLFRSGAGKKGDPFLYCKVDHKASATVEFQIRLDKAQWDSWPGVVMEG